MVLAMPTATTPLTAAGEPDQPDQLDLAFQALADRSRRAMVIRLTRGPASVSELAEPLKMSMPSVMQHIDVLQRSGLVQSEKVGRVRICRLEPGPMQTLEQWIAEHRAIWERHFDRLGQVLDEVFPETDVDQQGDRRA
jgi:DNA-binding transcriptional ArsR family regulator